jgi:hypothetical protein
MPNRALLTALAKAFLAGEPIVEQVIERGSRMLGRTWKWLPRLARRFVEAFPQGTCAEGICPSHNG